jgi:hypothetical protein
MIDEYVHPWDQPQPSSAAMDPAVVTTPRQVLDGVELGQGKARVYCTGCDRQLGEGDRLVVYAARTVDAPEWLVTRCYCPDCAPRRIETPTLGTSEVLASAHLGVRSHVSAQLHHLCLTEIELVERSSPAEDTR